MHRHAILLLLTVLLPAPLPAQGQEFFDFEALQKRPIVWVSDMPVVRWLRDRRHLYCVEGGKKLWVDSVDGSGSETAPTVQDPVALDPARKYLVVNAGNLCLLDFAPSGPGKPPAAHIVNLTTDGEANGRRMRALLNPSCTAVSFVRGNNLYVLDVDSKSEWAVTTDGGARKLHGCLDYLYWQEVYGRSDLAGQWWSPSGDHLAFLSLDETLVGDFTLVDECPEDPLDGRAVVTEVGRYPAAGAPNPLASVSIARRTDRQVVAVDLSRFAKDLLVVRVDWTPHGETLLLTLQDRVQSTADLVAVDVDTGAVTPWIHEQSDTWVDRPDPPQWLDDGSFLWLSRRTGYQHVYRYRPAGELVAALTRGDWQVRSILRIDQVEGLLWFEGTKDDATGNDCYRVGLDGSNLVRLTEGRGTHAIELNADASSFLDRWSAMDRPPSVRLCNRDGKVLRELGQAGKGAANRYAFADEQRLSIRARDGCVLDGSLIQPIGFDPHERYPVYLPTYCGPGSPSVRDEWSPDSYHQFLAQQGFLILQVNVRSVANAGREQRGSCYGKLGVQELKDLEDAVDLVCREHGGDPARVAIEGWSYGGFISAYALTHSTKFAVGIAGAGVYDWRLYDSIYTERYMRLPQQNAAGYDASSVIKAAADLHGFLTLLHGTMDDNVHVQNTMGLLWELQKAGKTNFELMLYPRSRHGLHRDVAGHMEQVQWRALRRLLDPAWKPQ